jgi:hypothetical protein
VEAKQTLVPLLRTLDIADVNIDVLQIHRALCHVVLALAA